MKAARMLHHSGYDVAIAVAFGSRGRFDRRRFHVSHEPVQGEERRRAALDVKTTARIALAVTQNELSESALERRCINVGNLIAARRGQFQKRFIQRGRSGGAPVALVPGDLRLGVAADYRGGENPPALPA